MEGPKFKVGDHVKISKCKNIFAKSYVPNWSEEIFVIKTIWNILLVILKAKKLLEGFTKNNYKKKIQKKFTVEKVIKRKGDTLYGKWKGYDNSFNTWFDRFDII